MKPAIAELEEAIRLARLKLDSAESFSDEERLAFDALHVAHENLRDAFRNTKEEILNDNAAG